MIERSKHVISYLYTETMCNLGYWNRWSRVGVNLYVSKIPLKKEEAKDDAKDEAKNEADQIIQFVNEHKEGPLRYVVSVVEEYEITEELPRMNPVRKEEWIKKGINHSLLEMADFKSDVSFTKAIDQIKETQDYRKRNLGVLIHCKAGRSRSAMIATCVLALYDLYDPQKTSTMLVDMAIAKILESRDWIKMADNRGTAIKIVSIARKQIYGMMLDVSIPRDLSDKVDSPSDQKHEDDLGVRINQCFANDEFKAFLKKTTSFQNLMTYRDQLNSRVLWKPKRAEYIDQLLESLDEAKDCEWYIDLLHSTGHSASLLHAAPFFTMSDVEKDRQTRENLLKDLKIEIEKILCTYLKCTESALREQFKVPLSPILGA